MKKATKYFGFVGLGALVVVGFVVSVNMVPTALNPDLQQYVETNNGIAKTDAFSKTPIYKLVQESPSPEKMEEFGFLLSKFEVPEGMEGVKTNINLGKVSRWTLSYLEYLSSRHERERLEGVQNAVKMYMSVLSRKPTMLLTLVSLSGLRDSMSWIKKQEWSRFSEKPLTALKSRVFELATQRQEIAARSLDGELAAIVNIMQTVTVSELVGTASSQPVEKALNVFLDRNATLNEVFQNLNERKTNLACLKDYSCEVQCADQTCWRPFFYQENFITMMNNPLGKKVLNVFDAKFTSYLMKLEGAFKKIEELSAS